MNINVKPGDKVDTRRGSADSPPARKRGRPALCEAEKRQNRREDIIKASSLLFFREGYTGTTLRRVAALAHVNVALIHYYFTSKQGLFQEVLNSAFAETLASLRRHQHAAPPLPHLVQVITAPLLAQQAFADTILFPNGPKESVAAITSIRRRVRLHLLAVLQTMQRTGRLRRDMDADLLTSTFLDLCWGPIRQLCEDGSEADAEKIATIERQISQNANVLEVAITLQTTKAF